MERTRPPYLKEPEELQREYGSDWYQHYYQYISSLAYQLFEWKNLPDSIDPRYLEMTLHMFGYVGFYKDKKLGYIASQGAVGGEVDHYLQPTTFQATSPKYSKQFDVYNYMDIKKENMGVVIWNNDYHYPTTPSLRLFAQDLAEIKEIIKINQKAQKTPVVLTANDKTRTSILNLYKKYEGNSPMIITHESVDPDALSVLNTEAPYVVDKLNIQRDAVWNELMTYMGINNANLEKRERMIVDEVESNVEQIEGSLNIYLKARKEACDRINDLYGLNLDVEMRQDVVREFQNQVVGDGGETNGNLHTDA